MSNDHNLKNDMLIRKKRQKNGVHDAMLSSMFPYWLSLGKTNNCNYRKQKTFSFTYSIFLLFVHFCLVCFLRRKYLIFLCFRTMYRRCWKSRSQSREITKSSSQEGYGYLLLDHSKSCLYLVKFQCTFFHLDIMIIRTLYMYIEWI